MNPYSARGSDRQQREAHARARSNDNAPALGEKHRRTQYESFESERPTKSRAYAPGSTVFDLYYTGLNSKLKKACEELSVEGRLVLEKRNLKLSYPLLFETGRHHDRGRNWMRGSDIDIITLAQAEQYSKSLDKPTRKNDIVTDPSTSTQNGAADTATTQDKAGANTSTTSASNTENRPDWFDARWKKPPPDVRVFVISGLEDVWPGRIVWMRDMRGDWHLAVILSINYLHGEVLVLTFFTYGGAGLDFRQDDRQFYVDVWDLDMDGKWSSKNDCPHPPVRIAGPGRPGQKFHKQFSQEMFLRVFPGEWVSIDLVVAIVGTVSPEFLSWALDCLDRCRNPGVPGTYDKAVQWCRKRPNGEQLLVNLMADRNEERAIIDQTPPDMSKHTNATSGARNKQPRADPLGPQWSPTTVPPYFLTNHRSLGDLLTKICTEEYRENVTQKLTRMDATLVICRTLLELQDKLRDDSTEEAFKNIAILKNDIEQLRLPEEASGARIRRLLLEDIEIRFEELKHKTHMTSAVKNIKGLGEGGKEGDRHEDDLDELQAEVEGVADPMKRSLGKTTSSSKDDISPNRAEDVGHRGSGYAEGNSLRAKIPQTTNVHEARGRSRSPVKIERRDSRRDRGSGGYGDGLWRGPFEDNCHDTQMRGQTPRGGRNFRGKGQRRKAEGQGANGRKKGRTVGRGDAHGAQDEPSKYDHYSPPRD